MDERIPEIYVSGIRAFDMAVRLKYAGVPEEKLKVFSDYDSLIGAMKTQALPVVILRFFNTTGPRQTGRYGMVLPRYDC